MTQRCDLSDLPVDGCHHCTHGTRNLGPAHSELYDVGLEESSD